MRECDPSEDVQNAALEVRPFCMYCGGNKGHSEIIHTDDLDSLNGFEIWFCCHTCRDNNKPCETFHKIQQL